MTTGLEQALLGAAAGGFGAGLASIVATSATARRSQRQSRHNERVEVALAEILRDLEGSHWRLLADYRRQVEQVEIASRHHAPPAPDVQPGTVPTVIASLTTATATLAWSELASVVDDLREAVRQLRLYVSRVEDDEYRAQFQRYYDAVRATYVRAHTAAHRGGGEINRAKVVAEPLIELLKLTNHRLGHSYWEPDD